MPGETQELPPLSRPVVNAAIEELRQISADMTLWNTEFGRWSRDRLAFVIVLLEHGDKG